MTASRERAKTLFLRAVELASPEECRVFLAEACGDDASLRQEVEELLRHHEQLGAFLEQPAAEPAATGAFTPVPPAADAEGPGTTIGPYKLVELIGEGGMGSVWMAQQTEPVKRLVALKVIRPGMDSKQVLARFEQERQALALMDHPHIAKVLDAGTTASGRPYFVMELVKGVSITKYCDDSRLTPRQRLELFIPVCQAVQHAHQKGIIHRDIKPSNILVCLYDGKPAAKVIDFGIAKAAGQQLTEHTLVTGFGAIVGTLEYMSPEQAEINQLDIDTRSDIYSLGVVLYELLTGTTPLDRKRLKEAAMLEVLRIIREEEPPTPSTRLSESKDALPLISTQRHMEPAKLTKLVRGELSWIVMKALEKDRNRRYETASAFAADVQRYLSDEPVQACPPSVWYRLGKFWQRNRAAVTFAAVVAVLLVTVAVGAVVAALQIDQARKDERKAKDQAVNDRRQAENDRHLAEQRGEEIRVGSDKLQKATTLIARARYFTDASRWPQAETALTEAVRLRPDLSQAWLERSNLYLRLGLWDEAAADCAEAFRHEDPVTPNQWYSHALLRLHVGDREGFRRLCRLLPERFPLTGSYLTQEEYELVQSCTLAPAPEADLSWAVAMASRGVKRVQGSSLNQVPLGLAHFRAGDYKRAAEAYQKISDSSPPGPAAWLNKNLGLALISQRLGKHADASKYLAVARQAIDNQRKALMNVPAGSLGSGWQWSLSGELLFREAQQEIEGTAPPEDAKVLIARSKALEALGSEQEAAALRARAARLGAASDVEIWLSRLQTYMRNGQWSKAEEACDQAVKEVPDSPEVWNMAGYVYQQRYRWDRAVAAYTRTIEVCARRKQTGQALVLVNAYRGRAENYRRLENRHAAITDLDRALELDATEPIYDRLRMLHLRGTLLYQVGDHLAASADLRRYIELGLSPKFLERDVKRNIDLQLPHLGEALMAAGRYAEAEKAFTDALVRQPNSVFFLWLRALDYNELKQYDRAIADYNRVIEQAPTYQRSLARRGKAYLEVGQPERAVDDCSKALALERNDSYPMALWNRAEAHDLLGQVDRAIADFKRAALIHSLSGRVLELGVRHLQKQHFESAAAYFSLWIQLAPGHPQGWEKRADTYFWERAYVKAVDDYSEVIRRNPKSVWSLSRRGLAYLSLGKLEQAVQDSSAALALDPRNFLALMARSQAYDQLGQVEKALADLRAGGNNMAGFASGLGQVRERKGDWKTALAYHARAIELVPQLPGGWAGQARALAALGQWDRAVASYSAALERNKGDDRAWIGRAAAHARLHQWDKALDDYKQALALRPGSAQAWKERAWLYLQRGQPREALSDYAQSGWLLATDSCNQALALLRQQEREKALAACRKEVEAHPRDAGAHQRLGDLLRNRYDLDGALAAYGVALGLDPRRSTTWLARADVYLSRREWHKVSANASEAIALDPALAKAWYDRGTAFLELGQYDRAADDLSRAIALDSQYAEAHCNLGHTLREQGHALKSLLELRRGHALGSRNPRWRYPSARWIQAGERLLELERKLPDFLDGTVKPASGAECLELAQLCARKRFHRAAAHFYESAFTGQGPAPAQLLAAHRYNAACAAALAGCGRGEDAVKPGDKEGARLRTQALHWLQEELAQAASQPLYDTTALQSILRHWNNDPDLNGVRDLEALVKLPPAEQEEWRRLWSEVQVAMGGMKDLVRQADRLRARGDLAGAVAALKKAHALAPRELSLSYSLVWLLALSPDPKVRDPKQAVAVAREAVAVDPRLGNSHRYLGIALLYARDYQAALEALNRAAQLRQGRDVFDYLALAMVHHHLGHTDEARRWHNAARREMAEKPVWSSMPETARLRDEAESLFGKKKPEARTPDNGLPRKK